MSMTQEEIDALLKGAQQTDITNESAIIMDAEPNAHIEVPDFGEIDMQSSTPLSSSGSDILSPLDPKFDMLFDLQLMVSIELGRTNMLIRDIVRLGRGSVIEFDKLVSEPVDVLVNGKKVAEGEVVVIDKHFGIRITTLVNPADRLRSLKK